MSLQANDKTVYELLNDKLYIVPINQRKYVWDHNNWQELFDDIKLAYEQKTPAHFIGSIVLKEESNSFGIKNCYSVVDGQQRISTLTILLCSIGLLFAEMNEKGLFEGLEKNLRVKNHKNESFTILSENSNKDIAALVNALFANVTLRFDSGMPMINTNELIKASQPKKRIEECFEFFYEKIKELIGDNKDNLELFLKTVQDMKYIDIVAKSDEDAFTIFEILNARGQPLRDFDMLKNYLLKYSADKDKPLVKESFDSIEECLGDSVDLFLKHYIIHKYGKKTDKAGNRPYKVFVLEEKANNKKRFLADLMKKSLYYQKIIFYSSCTALEKKVFSFFKPRRQQQFRPIVLSLMHQLELGGINQATYDQSIKYLYDFFIYFNIIGDQTSNKIEDIVYHYAKEIEDGLSLNTLDKMKESMSSRMPNKETFKNKLNSIRFSHKWKAYSGSKYSENVRAIFEIIEKEKGFIGEFDENYTIEHILPDSESEKNAVIGNLMLLEKTLNEKCMNKAINEKIGYYQKSNLFCPKQITDKFDIAVRMQEMSDLLYSFVEELKEKKEN